MLRVFSSGAAVKVLTGVTLVAYPVAGGYSAAYSYPRGSKGVFPPNRRLTFTVFPPGYSVNYNPRVYASARLALAAAFRGATAMVRLGR